MNYATQKPIKLLERIIRLYTNEGDLVIDPFAGSGTTGRAATLLKRDYLLIDINPKGKSLFEKQQDIISKELARLEAIKQKKYEKQQEVFVKKLVELETKDQLKENGEFSKELTDEEIYGIEQNCLRNAE